MASAGGKCTDRLNRRNGTNHNRQANWLEPRAGKKPASYSKYNTNPKPSKERDFKVRHFFSSCRIGKIDDSFNNEGKRKER